MHFSDGGDSSAWIWNIATAKFPEPNQIVDLYHAREHLHDDLDRLLALMFGDRKGRMAPARLEDPDYGDIDGTCRAARVYPLMGARKDELDTAPGHFQNNALLMRYNWFRSWGLFVGSGAVEAVVQSRDRAGTAARSVTPGGGRPGRPRAGRLPSRRRWRLGGRAGC